MIKIENARVDGFQEAIRGCRNSWDSHEKSDSGMYDGNFRMGNADHMLLLRLVQSGDCHAKCMRMVTVWFDLTAPRYFWTQFDTYKYLVRCSESTMHTITRRPLKLEDFEIDEQDGASELFTKAFAVILDMVNTMRRRYTEEGNAVAKRVWWRRIIKLLPQSYMQKSTICTNYQTLRNMYIWRKDHKLSEWSDFCSWVKTLPYSELITGEE